MSEDRCPHCGHLMMEAPIDGEAVRRWCPTGVRMPFSACSQQGGTYVPMLTPADCIASLLQEMTKSGKKPEALPSPEAT